MGCHLFMRNGARSETVLKKAKMWAKRVGLRLGSPLFAHFRFFSHNQNGLLSGTFLLSYSVLLGTHAEARCGHIGYCLFVCLLSVCLRACVCLYGYKFKASGVKFGTAVHLRPRQGIFAPQKTQNRTNRAWLARWPIRPIEMRRSWNIARRVDVGSACVDIRPSKKTYVLAFSFPLGYFVVSVPCARLSWPSRQLLSARKSTVSYRIVRMWAVGQTWTEQHCATNKKTFRHAFSLLFSRRACIR